VLDLRPVSKVSIKWNSRGFQTIINMNFSIEVSLTPVQEVFIPGQPDELIVSAQIKLRFVEGDNVIPWPIVLDFKHSQQLPGQVDSLALLGV
jgi:hypothetical protein